jgi:hypothetical protein
VVPGRGDRTGPDGALKVGLVAIAARRVPELAAWLPARPSEATDCGPCHGSGWLPPPFDRVQCPECFGMGWIPTPGHLAGTIAVDNGAGPFYDSMEGTGPD